MQTIAIANHKGGVGKSATTHALGVSLANLGYRVLLVDMDPQSSLSHGADVVVPGESIAEVLGGANPGTLAAADALVDISDTEGSTIHLLPSDIALSTQELGLVQRFGRENLLHNALLPIADRYDVCLIDCPPSLGILTVNALRAADGVIIPTQPQIADLRGLELFLGTVDNIRQAINPRLEIIGILVTMYDSRYLHHREALDLLRSRKLPVFETTIGRSIRVAESGTIGESIITYDPTNPQAERYSLLAKEIQEWLRSERR